MDYLVLKITFNLGKMLQHSLSTGEMTLVVAYSLLLCVSSYSWFYDSGVAKLFPASADQRHCDQAGVTCYGLMSLLMTLSYVCPAHLGRIMSQLSHSAPLQLGKRDLLSESHIV